MAESEVMMNMSKPDALQHIEITVLRQMGDQLAAQTRHLESLSGKVDDVRERVIRIEAKETDKQVRELKERVTALEALGNRVRGGADFGGWLIRAAPWLLTAVVVVAALLGVGKN